MTFASYCKPTVRAKAPQDQRRPAWASLLRTMAAVFTGTRYRSTAPTALNVSLTRNAPGLLTNLFPASSLRFQANFWSRLSVIAVSRRSLVLTARQLGSFPNMIQPPLLGVVKAASAVSARTLTCLAPAVPRSCSMLSMQQRRLYASVALHEGRRCHDRDVSERVQVEQIAVAGDDHIGLAADGQLQKFVVLRIAAGGDALGDRHQLGRGQHLPQPLRNRGGISRPNAAGLG